MLPPEVLTLTLALAAGPASTVPDTEVTGVVALPLEELLLEPPPPQPKKICGRQSSMKSLTIRELHDFIIFSFRWARFRTLRIFPDHTLACWKYPHAFLRRANRPIRNPILPGDDMVYKPCTSNAPGLWGVR
jgi:hypothetical protein